MGVRRLIVKQFTDLWFTSLVTYLLHVCCSAFKLVFDSWLNSHVSLFYAFEFTCVSHLKTHYLIMIIIIIIIRAAKFNDQLID